MSAVYLHAPEASALIAVVGVATAFFAATIAIVQTDIKKVLAYSTVSQLGYMFLGVGVGAFSAGFFHVVTHAFFKACLFLGAGSVIHALHARIHGVDASQDMRNMGGLRKYLPHTFWTFAASWAAIVGFPFTSGFFSKDEILLKAYTSSVMATSLPEGERAFQWPLWAGTVLYSLGLAGAVMTAFYMTRLFVGIFFGNFKGWKIVKHWHEPEHEHGHDAHHAAEPGEKLEGPKPHESPWQMWVPLAILGSLAAVAGFLNAQFLHMTAFEHWLEPVFHHASGSVRVAEGAEAKVPMFLAAAVVAFAVGVGAAYWVYVTQKGRPARELTEKAPGLYELVLDKWRIDELYDATVIGAVDTLAEISVWIDKWIVDGIIAGLSAFVVAAVGTLLRFLQTGRVQAYAAVMVIGLGGLGWFFFMPRAEWRSVENQATGAYSVTAAPGFGYSYKWDDDKAYGDDAERSFTLAPEGKRKVRLTVKNAFGRVATKEETFERPKPDKSAVVEVEPDEKGKLRPMPRTPGERPARQPLAPGRPGPGMPGIQQVNP
jgi:NADH-quinone oxidoreductase subunit L